MGLMGIRYVNYKGVNIMATANMSDYSNATRVKSRTKSKVIGTKREIETGNLHIIRLPNNTFKTVITYENKTVVFMARAFNKALRSSYDVDGCVVKVYVLKDDQTVDDVKWSNETSREYHYCTDSDLNEVTSLITSVLEYTGHELNISEFFNPIYVCDSMSINMKRVMRLYKDSIK